MNLIQKVIDYIEENLFYEITLDSISNEFHYSKYHLSREFNTTLGLSIPSYIKLRRLTESVLMMKEPKYQISDIAFKCGFNSTSYYIKVFKNSYNVTPAEYRRGKQYIQLIEKINIGGNKMFNNIEEVNKYIFNEYNTFDSVNQLFASIDKVVLNEVNDTSIDYFALLEDSKGHVLWECSLNILTGLSDKAIIAHDKNNPRIKMLKLTKEDDQVIVECLNNNTKKHHLGKLVDIGKGEYMVDMCRIGDKYINDLEHYIQEQPTEEMLNKMKKEVGFLFRCKNNIEIKEYIKSKDNIELLRLVNKKALIAYLINGDKTFMIYDSLLDLERKHYSYGYNSGFNNFDKQGILKWNSNVLEIRLDNQYFAELRLGTGELYKLYNSRYAIEFEGRLRGLSAISYPTKSK